MAVFVLQASQLPRSRPVQSPFCRVTCYMLHLVLLFRFFPPAVYNHGSFSWVLRKSSMEQKLKEILRPNTATTLVFFLFLFQSSSQTAIFCCFFFLQFFFFVFWTLKTQPCTIQSSKSLLLQPQLKIVYPKPHFPFTHLSFSKDGGRPAEVCQMDQQFYKARQ